MERITGSRVFTIICLILVTVFLNSCSMLGDLAGKAKVRKPQVEFAGGKLDGLSFSKANFLFDLKIRNPNSMGVKMAGFDYDFFINDNSFIKGRQDKGIEIEAQGESTVQLPISLGFVELYQTFQSLRDQDRSTYQINCGFSFDVPVLGVVNIPVSKTGDFPLLKLPKVSLDALRLRNLSLTGADLELRVGLTNPNAFSMMMERLQYQLEINETRWISGDARENTQIMEKGDSFINIPISISFLEVGRSVYKLFTGNDSLNYQFGGNVDLATSVPLLGQVNLPFDRSGQIKILR